MLNVSDLEATDRLRFVSNARARHVRGFVVDDRPDPALLRRQICDRADLDACVLHWLSLRGFTIDPEVAHVLRLMVKHGGEGSNLIDMAGGDQATELRWRRRLRATRIGLPGRWHPVLRMLTVGVVIQADPEARLPAIALHTGFSDATSLSRACADARARGRSASGSAGRSCSVLRWHEPVLDPR